MLKIALCEDEAVQREIAVMLLREYLEHSGKVGHCIFVEDICANAKGYGMLYQIQKKGR